MARMLYVEDDPRDFEAYAEPLSLDYAWKVDHAEGPDEALEKLANCAYDVILIDRQMPNPKTGRMEMLGDGLLEEVAARWRYVCPIVLTHFGDIEAAQRATRYGAFHYFIKGISAADLDRACRKGMQWQLVRRIRHRLLTASSTDAVVAEVKARVKEILHPPGYCFAYLRLEARGSLLIGDCECTASSGPLAKAIRKNCAFLADFPVTKEAAKTSQFVLKKKRADIVPEEGTLLENPGSQLIVPVLHPDNGLVKRRPSEVSALIWVESLEEDAFDRDDADILSELADYVGAVLAKAEQMERSSVVAQEFERNGLLSELAERICDPLQTAQSTVDLLIARLKRGPVDLVESQEELLTARTALERAIQEAYQLREITRSRRVTLMPTDLRLAVAQVTSSFTPLCTAGGCQVQTRIAEHVPKVKVEPAEMRYALNCLLDNAAQAIDRRQRTAAGEPAEGEIVVSLCADPSADRSVLITVQDSGGGIADEHLAHVFDRYFDTGLATPGEKSATRLWAVRRFVEGIGGKITAKSILDEKGNRRGAAFQVLLPACGDNDAPQEITL